MSRSLRLLFATALLAVLALGTVASTAAGGPKILDARMAPVTVPNQVLQGLTGGGAPWSIEEGKATLFADGRLHVEVEGLIVIARGNNPIPQGRAIITCSSAPAVSSPIVPFSTAGDAEVNARVTLPASCLAPAVFFVGVTATGAQPWFAVTGF